MSTKRTWLMVLFAGLITSTQANSVETVFNGKTEGSFAVSPTGAAIYTVPS